MLQAYSTNINVAASEAFTFNNVTLKKGCTATLSGPSTISLNTRGLYMVAVDAYGSAVGAGDTAIQLYRNGVALPQAINSATTETGNIYNFYFQTLVQVTENNSNCCCSSPTTIQVMNGDVALESAHCNIVVTKVC